jgi:hypothetical protein
MSNVPPHVEEKWKMVERKAQLPGATLSGLLNDIGDALEAYVIWWLNKWSVEQLAQADNREDRQSNPVKDDSES